jgi:predicted RNA-binding protein
MVTLPVLLSRLERLWTQFPDSDYYSPSALLRAMVAEDVSILDLQKDHCQVLIKRLRDIMASEHEGKGKESRMLPAHRIASRL